MYTILMDALCLDCQSALLLSEDVNNEAAIESLLALILLDFFGDIAIDEVNVTVAPATSDQPSLHALHLQASSARNTLDTPLTLLEARLEEAICCALLEHFHTVVINAVEVYDALDDDAPPTSHA